MDKNKLAQLLDEILSNGKVIDDINKELAEAGASLAHIELNSNVTPIPVDVSITVVTKAFFKEYLDEIGFGTFRVMVALGEVTKRKSGCIEAEHGFSTLYYDDDAELITLDFHTEMR